MTYTSADISTLLTSEGVSPEGVKHIVLDNLTSFAAGAEDERKMLEDTMAKIAQFAQRDGIEIPRWVALKMEGFLDDAASIRAFGIEVVARLCERLIAGGAPGIHFYTLNRSLATRVVCVSLRSMG